MRDRIVRMFNILKEMHSLPKLTLTIFSENEDTYNYFTKPHPRYRVIKNKKWGVAIQEIPEIFEDYLRGRKKQALRTNRKKCLNEGYYFCTFSSNKFTMEIIDINMSSSVRQGKQMNKSYLDINEVEKWTADKPNLYGVFDKNKTLKAYAYAPVIGEVCIISRLLGHYDALEDGIMYLLISEIIHDFVGKRQVLNYPKYIMYDTFFGASKGLRYFKERLGFEPYKIRWKLE